MRIALLWGSDNDREFAQSLVDAEHSVHPFLIQKKGDSEESLTAAMQTARDMGFEPTIVGTAELEEAFEEANSDGGLGILDERTRSPEMRAKVKAEDHMFILAGAGIKFARSVQCEQLILSAPSVLDRETIAERMAMFGRVFAFRQNCRFEIVLR